MLNITYHQEVYRFVLCSVGPVHNRKKLFFKCAQTQTHFPVLRKSAAIYAVQTHKVARVIKTRGLVLKEEFP
jgi:hypothetical protein